MEVNYQLKVRSKQFLADTFTPVAAYLKLRDRFANTLLLESSDYHGEENSFSYICCKPKATFESTNGKVTITMPGENPQPVDKQPLEALKEFRSAFSHVKEQKSHIETGLFGYISYDGVQHFEEIELKESGENIPVIPEIKYSVYNYIIAFDHFRNQCHVIETYVDQVDDGEFNEIIDILHKQTSPQFDFQTVGETQSDFTDEEFLEKVKVGIHNCDIGEVFQVVFSRRFYKEFQGDEFQVYRALRSINPSPYLFYFDYGSYKIFGSSPEAQIVINPKEAIIYPIAGTFRRTGDDLADADLAKKLLNDPKENSEHIMLVDLARNDLSKFTSEVKVETYKEIQFYSHVIHLVSKVTGQLNENTDLMDVVASTFPAGTLSGAPKFRAMELIDENEKSSRGYYGGAIGFMDFEGTFNHAIMIRTFLSESNTLHYRAGAGIVAKSDPKSEVQEVYNKLAALETALTTAEKHSAQ
ncbi:MAG: anthranilate synthase component I family protein [Cyclobacteriaceae bacterium]